MDTAPFCPVCGADLTSGPQHSFLLYLDVASESFSTQPPVYQRGWEKKSIVYWWLVELWCSLTFWKREAQGPGPGGEFGESLNLSQCNREFPFIWFKHLKYWVADTWAFHWGVPWIFLRKLKKKKNESCKVNGMQASDLINSHPHKCFCSFFISRWNWVRWNISEALSSKEQTVWGQKVIQVGSPSWRRHHVFLTYLECEDQNSPFHKWGNRPREQKLSQVIWLASEKAGNGTRLLRSPNFWGN